jgi:hypothetical protein
VTTPGWKFDFAPIPVGGGDADQPDHDLVVATRADADAARVAELLRALATSISVTPLLSAHPLFWTRIEASDSIEKTEVRRRLSDGGIDVRYVTSARRGTQALPPPLDFENARPRRASDWVARQAGPLSERDTPWRWFLREAGADVDRRVCGTGTGTRLAVIDNDGRDVEHVDIDAMLPVFVTEIPRATSHAALLLGWCVAGNTPGGRFHGVAPHASPRFYCIPKPNDDVFTLPLAIARAVDDGADVVVCATYIDGQTSPLLDDALEFAVRLGRAGRGAVLVFPTGREMSSPPGSRHSSLSLGLGEPASDPRVFGVGPSARDGRWFLWRDKRGRLRPFANRSPALRFLAPGDDIAYPFSDEDRPTHAESSGAAAVAAGVVLLTLSQNPELSLGELDVALRETVNRVDGARQLDDRDLGDPADLLPRDIDPDGHNAKHGYGRLSAARACMTVLDPLSASLCRIGERGAALRYLDLRTSGAVPRFYTDRTAAWAARALLREQHLTHAFCSLSRAIRLFCARPENLRTQPPGHVLRHIALALRALLLSHPPEEQLRELAELERRVRALLAEPSYAAHWEENAVTALTDLWRELTDDAGERSALGVVCIDSEPLSRA